MQRLMIWITSTSLMLLGAGLASSQAYPIKPVRIVTSEAGGGSDLVARLIAQGMSAPLGQQVIVDNRAGIIAVQTVAKALSDGYTLLLYSSVIWIEPLMRDNVPWDPVRDFAPITLAVSSPNILVVHPLLPANSVKELIALAKAKPGVLNYGSTSTGGSSHLATELFKAMAGVDIMRIPYKGIALAVNDLIGGQVQVMFPTAGSVAAHVKSGRLRALAVTSAQPSALLPGLPTVAAAGVPGYEATTIYGVFVPAKTPATLVGRLNQEIVRVLNREDVKEKVFNAGIEVVGSSPEHLARTVKSEMARLGKVIKDAGMRGQ